jgi:YVTN family beta-propeller protein
VATRPIGLCEDTKTSTSSIGTPLPLVTLLTQGELAVGTSARLIPVGVSPTVVIPFNDAVHVTTSGSITACTHSITVYSGAQSALVVNTGSNSVQVVQIGQYAYPTGTVSVGNQPVAAAINSAETMAYVANYADNTVSEVNLSTLQQTRIIGVMTHPASLTFDASGNLWVGGQGAVDSINIGSWTVASSTAVNGTVNGMSYDAAEGALIQTTLQNGTTAAPSNSSTAANPIAYTSAPQVSYTTQTSFNVATGSVTTTSVLGDNAAYSLSTAAAYLAYPGQTAFSPPIYSSSNGDITATVTGTSFTVSTVATGSILIQGTLPYPARGVALTNNMVYFTMPDTNSLVSLPIQVP